MGQFGTVITAMVTPFDENLKVDLNKAQRLANYLVENGSDGLVVSGTTGESPTLSQNEKIQLFKAVKDAVGKDVQVIGGTGSYSTHESIELSQAAQATGINAVMLVVPYYNKPPQSGLFAHFSSVANSVELPVILYNVPSRTSCNLDADTVIKLSEISNIVALKEAGSDVSQITRVVAETPNDFSVYCGQDEWNLPMLSLGASGFISVSAHVVGNEISEMARLYFSGDRIGAQRIHEALIPVHKALFKVTNPIMVKAAMSIIWEEVGIPRLPLVEATQEQKNELKTILDSIEKTSSRKSVVGSKT